MHWFRMPTDTHKSLEVRMLLDKYGPEGPMVYYFALEMCLELVRGAKSNITCIFERHFFERTMGVGTRRVHDILEMTSALGIFDVFINNSQISLKVVNISKYLRQSDLVDGPIVPLDSPVPKPVEKVTKTKLKKKEKLGAIPEFSAPRSVADLLENVSEKLQLSWLSAYPDSQWVLHQMQMAHAWILANPKKAPRKRFGAFMTSWLSRAFESHRKSIPSAKLSFAQQRENETLARMRILGEELGLNINQDLLKGADWIIQKK